MARIAPPPLVRIDLAFAGKADVPPIAALSPFPTTLRWNVRVGSRLSIQLRDSTGSAVARNFATRTHRPTCSKTWRDWQADCEEARQAVEIPVLDRGTPCSELWCSDPAERSAGQVILSVQ